MKNKPQNEAKVPGKKRMFESILHALSRTQDSYKLPIDINYGLNTFALFNQGNRRCGVSFAV